MSVKATKEFEQAFANAAEAKKNYEKEVELNAKKHEYESKKLELEKERESLNQQKLALQKVEESKEKAIANYVPDEFAIHKAENGWVVHHVRKQRNGEFQLPAYHEVYYTAQELLDRMSEILKKQIELDNE